jgi:hypothetical protein
MINEKKKRHTYKSVGNTTYSKRKKKERNDRITHTHTYSSEFRKKKRLDSIRMLLFIGIMPT